MARMVGMVGMARMVRMVGMVRMVQMVRVVGEPGASSHRIVHGSALSWWRRVRIGSSCSTTVIGRVVERIAGGDVLANVRRRVSGIVGVAVDAHVGRRGRSRRRKRVLTIGRSSRGWYTQSTFVCRVLLLCRRFHLVEDGLWVDASPVELAFPRKKTFGVVFAQSIGGAGGGADAQCGSYILPSLVLCHFLKTAPVPDEQIEPEEIQRILGNGRTSCNRTAFLFHEAQ